MSEKAGSPSQREWISEVLHATTVVELHLEDRHHQELFPSSPHCHLGCCRTCYSLTAATMSSASRVDVGTSLNGEEMGSVTASDNAGSGYIQFPRRRRTIPELLASRERFGLLSTPQNRCVVKNYQLDCPRLAFRGAWCVASVYLSLFGGTCTMKFCPLQGATN